MRVIIVDNNQFVNCVEDVNQVKFSKDKLIMELPNLQFKRVVLDEIASIGCQDISLDKVADLEVKLAEKERQYETLYKLFSEQHEIIDQNELECFEEVNRLLKEQKDFYVVEKVEYDKMKQGAKDIVDKLKQQLAEKEKKLNDWKDGTIICKWTDAENKVKDLEHQLSEKEELIMFADRTIKGLVLAKEIDKISFAVAELEKVKDATENILDKALKNCSLNQGYYDKLLDYIDNQIKQLKEME